MQAAGTLAARARVATGPEVLDWAEQRYPQSFPGPVPDRVAAPYEIYRHYPTSGNYLGVSAGSVYLLGPLSGGRLSKVGTLAGYSAQALANQLAATDEQAARFLMHATLAPTEADIAAVRLTVLCAGQLGEPARRLIATAVAAMPDTTVGDRRRRVQAAVMLVMASPEYLVQR